MKFLNRALLFAACFMFVAHAGNQPEQTIKQFYKNISTPIFFAEGVSEEKKEADQKSDLQLSTAQEAKPLFKPVDFTIVVPTKTEEVTLWFQLLDLLPEKSIAKNLIDDGVAEKLNIISGTNSDKSHNLRSALPTITTMGKIGATEELMLCNNTRRNQTVIKHLNQNPQLLERLQQALKKVDSGFGMYLTFFKKTDDFTNLVFQSYFFNNFFNKFGLNKSELAFNATRFFSTVFTYSLALPLPAAIITAGVIGASKLIGKDAPLNGLSEKAKKTFNEASDDGKKLMIQLGITSLIGPWVAYKMVTQENSLFNNLQTRLIGVANIINGLNEINEISAESGLRELSQITEAITTFLYPKTNNAYDLKKLFEKLDANTFKGEPSYWSNRARILVTYTLFQENKVAFIPALHALGTIDALQAATQLYRDHQDKPARYSFVTFVNDELPTIQLTNFWNPLMRAEQAVCNNVHLGNGGDKNMLLTGPNGSGKSVNMKAIALNIILAQAFGIAAADNAILTPFTMIETYLNEQEDLQQGLSTFMAEAKKLDTICKRIRNLKPGQKSFVLMDEMLKGTVEEAGSQKVYEAGLKIAQQDNNICIMATHFLKPTELEVDTNRGFVNYHVGLLEPELGQFVRTFKLVPEANLWWFGKNEEDAAKRARFISWLTSLNS